MKVFIHTLLFVFLASTFTTYGQVRKTPTPQTAAPTPALNPNDYKYYILVRRNELSPKNPNFTLPNQGGYGTSSISTYESAFIIADSRTMKELSWWPEGVTYLTGNSLYVLSNENSSTYGKVLYRFATNGKLVYRKPLKWQSPTGQADVQVSSDWKHVYTIFNKDAWAGDLNLESGAISNMRQVTQSGIMNFIQGSYMKENILLLSGCMININNGSYKKVGNAIQINEDIGNFFNTQRNPVDNVESAIYDFANGKKVRDTYDEVLWLDRKHTKVLESIQNLKPNSPNRQVIDLKSYALSQIGIPVKWKYAGITRYTPNQLSPSGRFHFAMGQTTSTNQPKPQDFELFVYDNESLSENKFPVRPSPPVSTLYETFLGWSDDSHVFFSLAEQYGYLNKEAITTDNQGTYTLDLASGSIKRVMPYFIKNYLTDFIQLSSAGKVVFEANNYLYNCNTDGSGLIQLTKLPSVYKLQERFINQVSQ